MVVDDFHIVGIAVFPDKADAPLLVDANAVLAEAITFEGLESITRRCVQILENSRPVQDEKLAPGRTFELPESAHESIVEQGLCAPAPERSNHTRSVQRVTFYVKRRRNTR